MSFGSPQAADHAGIATIYQELDLVPGLSVAENVVLGHEPARLGFTRPRDAEERARGLLRRLGHPEIPPRRELGRLSAAGQQVVSMARALARDARLIVMDEPSAVLDPEEVQNLFRVIRELTADGVAVVYISHRLEEIRQIGDRVTVLKDGRTVARNLPARDTPTAEVIRLMTGRSIEYVFPRADRRRPADEVVLEVDGLSRTGEFADVSFTVRGRRGGRPGRAGRVGPLGDPGDRLRRPQADRRHGPGARQGAAPRLGAGRGPGPDGAVPRGAQEPGPAAGRAGVPQRVACPRCAASPAPGSSAGTPSWPRPARSPRQLDVRPPDATRPVRTLSGGNQQKVVLARWLLQGCDVLLLDEPTRGVDVGARSEIYALIRRLADAGVAVLLVSSEVPEVLGLADRVLVVREGRVVHAGAERASSTRAGCSTW